ncbi:MAG TPA: hypothetical protein VNW68_01090 [Candidatus Limnocylindria bacterium]|jgi:hypothetical protein|nr:hypothetical protein [Candidatus Limnocylindria bacterium]
MRPNPPRMITVAVAVALTVIGLALLYLPAGEASDLVRQVGLPGNIESTLLSLIADRLTAYLALALSPLLLVAGSLLKGL